MEKQKNLKKHKDVIILRQLRIEKWLCAMLI